MRSQFRPAQVPSLSGGGLSTPNLLRQNARIKAWMLALGGLLGMLLLGLAVLFFSVSDLMTLLPGAGNGNAPQPGLGQAVAVALLLGTALGQLGLLAGLMWQVWRWVQTLTEYASSTGAHAAQAFVQQGKRLAVWVRVWQVGPFLLFLAGLVLSAAGQLTQQALLGDAGGTLGFSLESPRETLRTMVSLLFNFFILEAIRQWLRAVNAHALGNKNPISPKLGPVGGWTLLWYLGLGSVTLGALALGGLTLTVSPTDLLKSVRPLPLTPLQMGTFSRLFGAVQGTLVIAILMNITLMVLLTLLRQFAAEVTTALDERSYGARRAMQDERWSGVT